MIVVAIIGLLASVAIPNLIQASNKAKQTGCIQNLRAIAGAKANWSLDMKKSSADVPTDADLFGADKYISDKPSCPGGGTYSINEVAAKPTCTLPDHNY